MDNAHFAFSGRFLVGLAAMVLVAAADLSAHPSHSSFAEVEWSERGTLDVALKVIPEDLERALSTQARRTMVLVDTPEVRSVLSAYLQQHFRLLHSASPGARSAAPAGDEDTGATLELVGMELDYRDTWIYFSIATPLTEKPRSGIASGDPSGLQRITLRNTLLMDVEPGQTNRVRRLWAPDASVLVFSTTEPQRDLMVVTSE